MWTASRSTSGWSATWRPSTPPRWPTSWPPAASRSSPRSRPDADGVVHNLNADTAAAALAVALGARKLVVLTDVEGLYADWPDTDVADLADRRRRAGGAAARASTEGMVPKMEACLRAVRGGVPAAPRGRRPGAALGAAGDLHRRGVRDDGDADHDAQLTQRLVAASVMDTYGTPSLGRWCAARAPWSGTPTARSYVDLLAGIAVNALGHAHPAVVAAVTRQIATLGHVLQPVRSPSRRWPLAERLLAAGRPAPAGCSSPTPAPRPTRRRSSSSRRTGRTHVVAAEGGVPRPHHGRAGADRPAGQGRPVPAAARRRHARALRRRRRARPPRSPTRPRWCSWSRSRARPASWSPPRRLPGRRPARSPTRPAPCSSSTRCRPASAAPATGSPTRPTASRPTWSRWPRASAAACRSAPAWPSATPADLLGPGTHGSTFGGNPVACAAALAVLDTIEREDLLDHVKRARRAAAPRASRRSATRWWPACAGAGCCSASC